MRKSLFLILISTVWTLGLSSMESLENQRFQFEEQLRKKLIDSVSSGLKSTPFVLNVSVELKPSASAAPKPADPSTSATPSSKSNLPLGKLDFDTGLKTEASETESAPPNLFKEIDRVKVSLILDTAVPDAKKDTFKRILIGVLGGIGEKPPEVNVERIDLAPAPEEKPEKPWDSKRWIMELKNPIVILFSALLTLLFAFMMFQQHQRLEARKVSLMEAQNTKAQAEAEGGAEETRVAEQAKADEGEALDGPSLSSQIQYLIEHSPEVIQGLISQWLHIPTVEAQSALAYLPRKLSMGNLLELMKAVKEEDRKEWKKILSQTQRIDTQSTERFISRALVEALLASSPKVDEELKKLLEDLSVSECLELINQNIEWGALLANWLPASEVSYLMSVLSVDQANSMAAAGTRITTEAMQEKASELKQAIQQMKTQAKASTTPFLDRAVDMLQTVQPEKEGALYNSLIESKEYALLKAAAQKYFPAELVLKLPEKILKAGLDRLSLARRAELIFSRPDDQKTPLIDAIGKAGTKTRELIDVEIQQITQDTIRQRRAEKNQSQLWKAYIKEVREYISQNETASELADPILNAWLSEKTNGEVGAPEGGSSGQTSAA